MPDNKKHHYVPKFLLKRFSENRKSINLFILEKKRRVISANLSNQCYENYFYGVDDGPEKALGAIETEASLIIEKICRDSVLPQDRVERFSLLIFIVFQRARTLAAANELNDFNDKTLKEVMGHEIDKTIKEVMGDEVEGGGFTSDDFKINLKEPALFSLEMATKTYPLLVDLSVKLLVNRTSENFVLSDNPVVYYNQLMNYERHISSIGAACKGLQILFPLDANHCLLMFDDSSYSVPGNCWATLEITDVRDIYNLNMLQVCSADSVFYFKRADQSVENIVKKASPYLKSKEAKLQVLNIDKDDGGESRFIMMSRPQIRCNLTLTFMRIRTSAKKWRDWFRRPGELRPAVEIRNHGLIEDNEEFMRLVEEGKFAWTDFFLFVNQKYHREGSADA